MKLIKTAVRNTITDNRLNDLCLLTIERDIDINFEQLMDKFPDIHKKYSYYVKINFFIFCL